MFLFFPQGHVRAMWVSWFLDQIIQVRVLASPLPHSVKRNQSIQCLSKGLPFPHSVKETIAFAFNWIIEDGENWALNQYVEDGKNWVLNQVMPDFLFFSFLGYCLPAWLSSQRQYDRPDRKDWMHKRVPLTVWEFRWQRILSICQFLTTLFCLVWHFWRPRVCVTLLMT